MNLASMTKQEKDEIMNKFSSSEVGVLIENLRDDIKAVGELAIQTSNDVADIKITMVIMQNDIAEIRTILDRHDTRILKLESA